MFPNWAKNILYLLVYMISGLVLVVIIEGLLSGADLNPLNTAVEGVMMHLRTPILTTVLVELTKITDPFVIASVAVFVAVLLIIKKHIYDGSLLLTALFLSIISLNVLKNVFQINRPSSELLPGEGWSFPSGHATVATAFFFLISVIFFNKLESPRAKTYLVVGSFFGAALISFTRLYLSALSSLDILAGIALGLLSVSFTVLLFNVFIGENRSVRKMINL